MPRPPNQKAKKDYRVSSLGSILRSIPNASSDIISSKRVYASIGTVDHLVSVINFAILGSISSIDVLKIYCSFKDDRDLQSPLKAGFGSISKSCLKLGSLLFKLLDPGTELLPLSLGIIFPLPATLQLGLQRGQFLKPDCPTRRQA